MSEVLDSLIARIEASYGESPEVNAKLDFAKSMLEDAKASHKLLAAYIESILQIAGEYERSRVVVISGSCSGFSTTVTCVVKEGSAG